MHNVRKISILHKFLENFLKILLFVKIVESEFSQYLDFSKKKFKILTFVKIFETSWY